MSGEKILIVDDDKEFGEELGQTLFSCEYQVQTVSNGDNVLEAARSNKPDLILLDLKMTGASGFLLAQSLKDSPDTREIPIIAMSGHFPIDNRNNLLDMHNMDGRIKKPFGVTELITEIEDALSRKDKHSVNE